MIYKRKLVSKLENILERKEIFVITGMRRTGKTTLLKYFFDRIPDENKVFLDLDNYTDRKIFDEEDYNNIWFNLKYYNIQKNRKAYIFIDEIQSMPGITKAIKYLYDHYDVKFLVTGSSSFYLKNLFPESLAGRKFIFELYPLDFEEYLAFNDVERENYNTLESKSLNKNKISFEKHKKYFEEYLYYGGFPQVVLSANETEKRMQLKDIFNSYIEKEVYHLSDFKKIDSFRDLMFILLKRAGSKIDIQKLSNTVKISRETVNNYLSFLESTYFVFLLKPYSKSPDKEISKTRKVYFCDNGILTQFGNTDEGNLFENAVYLNLREYGNLRYYNKKSGIEIDFLIPDKKTAIEAKTSPDTSLFKKLDRISKELKFKEYYVISKVFKNLDNLIISTEL